MTLALIFDCDGVLSDTEQYGHLPAYNQMFREMGLPIQWSVEEYGDKLRICGGNERLTSLLTDDFVRAAGLPTEIVSQTAEVARWYKRKTEIYTQMGAAGCLPPRPGIRRMPQAAVKPAVICEYGTVPVNNFRNDNSNPSRANGIARKRLSRMVTLKRE